MYHNRTKRAIMYPSLRVVCCLLATMSAVFPQPRAVAPAEKNPFDTPQDVEQGQRLFQTHCSYCHGTQGEGGRGADLTNGQYRHGGSDPELFLTVRNGILGTEMPAVRATNDEVWRLVAFVRKIGSSGLAEKAPGDPVEGKKIYEVKGGCVACHSIDNVGGVLGPDLAGIGRRRGLKFLEQSLVKPEADLPPNYRAVRVNTKAGQSVTGIRLNEDDLSVQVRDTAGNPRSILKANIKEIRRDQPSLMPSYESTLNAKELGDLVAYLSSLRGAQ